MPAVPLTRRTLVAVTAAAALCAAGPVAAAQADPEVGVAHDCVRQDQPVEFSLTGYDPGTDVDLLLDDADLDTVTTDETGAFSGAFDAPALGGARTAGHTLSDIDGDSTDFTVTALGVTQTPAAPRPSGKVTVRAYGFVEGGTLYAHYLRHPSAAKWVLKKTARIGVLAGDCGTLRAKVPALPVSRPSSGTWTVQFDLRRSFRPQAAPYATTSVLVKKPA